MKFRSLYNSAIVYVVLVCKIVGDCKQFAIKTNYAVI